MEPTSGLEALTCSLRDSEEPGERRALIPGPRHIARGRAGSAGGLTARGTRDGRMGGISAPSRPAGALNGKAERFDQLDLASVRCGRLVFTLLPRAIALGIEGRP